MVDYITPTGWTLSLLVEQRSPTTPSAHPHLWLSSEWYPQYGLCGLLNINTSLVSLHWLPVFIWFSVRWLSVIKNKINNFTKHLHLFCILLFPPCSHINKQKHAIKQLDIYTGAWVYMCTHTHTHKQTNKGMDTCSHKNTVEGMTHLQTHPQTKG